MTDLKDYTKVYGSHPEIRRAHKSLINLFHMHAPNDTNQLIQIFHRFTHYFYCN